MLRWRMVLGTLIVAALVGYGSTIALLLAVTSHISTDVASVPFLWIVPLSLGDSHHGFRVLGTSAEYFERYKYRHGQNLKFAEGGPFSDLFDAVIGADVAEALGYKVGDPIVVAHGLETGDGHCLV